jgi:endoglucanase
MPVRENSFRPDQNQRKPMARQSKGTPAIAMTALLFAATLAAPAAELTVNGGFDAGTQGWWATANLSLSVRDGKLCADVPGGASNPWDAIIGQDNVPLEKGRDYRLAFTASGDPEGPVRALVQMPKPPYTFYVEAAGIAAPGGAENQAGFAAPVTMKNAQIVMQVGGNSEPWTVCLDNVSLDSGKAVDAYRPDTGPRVRVNQVGYLPDGPKHATLVTDSTDPMPWRLIDAAGNEILSGRTTPRGIDPSAGLNVQTIDFSATGRTGDGFVLETDGERSYPFPIRADIYAGLPRDALGYYYPVRSGIAIDGAIAGEAYARPAGHVSAPGDGEANKGDRDVPCQSPESSRKAYGEPWTCDYTLDVTGGWYDAGDHGKYVVNGGISVAQLMAAYERALTVKNAPPAAKADSALAIPEAGNGVPDILDEARWELEFMLEMMVPDGEPLAGMVHHKVHDDGWTGLPTLPDRDDKVRELHRPSTAATLNLAAAAAQGARLFEPFDEAFSAKLLAAAEKAYRAARARPALFAPGADGASGGGAYDDADVTDEFYWAAAELFITTGAKPYLADLRASPYWNGEAFRPGGFDWANVAALGRMALATVPSRLPEQDADAARKSVIVAADRYLAMQAGQPFGQIYAPKGGEYDWGSNHLMLQNAIVVARAYDLTAERKYRDAVIEGVGYIFGRNALNRSYVTGYGKVFSKNQHSRWFAHQLDPDLPNPPKGSLAGGPNSGIQDPVAQRLLQGCAPQLCYVDDIESWSTNEITINWNAALSELAAFLAGQ